MGGSALGEPAGQGMGASGAGGVWKDPVPSRSGRPWGRERAQGERRGARRAPAEARPEQPGPRRGAMLPPGAPRGYCCPSAPVSWSPPCRPAGRLSGSCKDTAQLNVQTPNRKRGGDPVVTPCAHEMPAVAEHRATRPGSYEPAGTGHRAGTVAPCEVKHSVIM